MTLSLLPIDYNPSSKDNEELSFSERLSLAVEHSKENVLVNNTTKPYDWQNEASQKRFIR